MTPMAHFGTSQSSVHSHVFLYGAGEGAALLPPSRGSLHTAATASVACDARDARAGLCHKKDMGYVSFRSAGGGAALRPRARARVGLLSPRPR